MPKIVAYHPEIWVRTEDGMVMIDLTMDDWYSDEEILEQLKESYPSCETFGELVETIKGNGESPKKESGVVCSCIREGKLKCDAEFIRDWDDKI